MALITRFSRLLRADMHAVLDLVEEPEQMLAQAIRDMESSVQRADLEVKATRHGHRQLGLRIEKVRKWLAELEQELDVCFGDSRDAENEALARSVLRKKIAAERLHRELEQDRTHVEAELLDLEQRVATQRSELAELRQKAEVLAPAEVPGSDSVNVADMGYTPTAVSDEDVEIALLRERRARSAS